MKIKATQNKAEDVEVKPEVRPDNRTIEQMTSEELGLALNNLYSQLMQINNHIAQVNGELQKRQVK